jgi:hypothetical protein
MNFFETFANNARVHVQPHKVERAETRVVSLLARMVHKVVRMAKATVLAIGLTALFVIPGLMIHIPLWLLAPLSGGYMTGGLRRLSGGEACALGLTLGLMVGLPAPLAHHELGFLSSLSSLAIIFFSCVAAVYYGTLITIAAWYGGTVARREKSG